MSAERPLAEEGPTEEQSSGRRQGQDTSEARFLAAHHALRTARAEFKAARLDLLDERRRDGHGKREGVTSGIRHRRVLTAAGKAMVAAYRATLGGEHWVAQSCEFVRPSRLPR